MDFVTCTMNILDQIIARKRVEVDQRKGKKSISSLEKAPFFDRKTISLTDKLSSNQEVGIIAEHKRKSPSKGIINDQLQVEDVTLGYQHAGASALSILTDVDFFGGRDEDILQVRSQIQIPILRKDFIIDPYQLWEAKAMGADVILLIAANLSPQVLNALAATARQLSLDILMEVHDLEELESHMNEHISMVGVNNRNLKTFEVSLETSLALAEKIPSSVVKVAESGIYTAQDIFMLQKAGFHGFLIGESFMKTIDPGLACQSLINEVLHLHS